MSQWIQLGEDEPFHAVSYLRDKAVRIKCKTHYRGGGIALLRTERIVDEVPVGETKCRQCAAYEAEKTNA